jgi:hypothetical protein
MRIAPIDVRIKTYTASFKDIQIPTTALDANVRRDLGVIDARQWKRAQQVAVVYYWLKLAKALLQAVFTKGMFATGLFRHLPEDKSL